MCHLGVVLYEYLGEEYPEVLGSILGGLKVGGRGKCVVQCGGRGRCVVQCGGRGRCVVQCGRRGRCVVQCGGRGRCVVQCGGRGWRCVVQWSVWFLLSRRW